MCGINPWLIQYMILQKKLIMSYESMDDIELLAEYNRVCIEIEELEYGSYEYDCLAAEFEYLYGMLVKKELV